MTPVISEIKYLGGGTLDFIEVRIPDDYPDPENLVLVIYDRSHDGSTTATPSASDMHAIASVGDTSNDTDADGRTHYTIGSDYNGTTIFLHAQDAVGLYNAATGETYGLYSWGQDYTVSTAAVQPDGTTADPFAGQPTTVLPTTPSIGDSLVINEDGTYSPTDTPTPGSSAICFCDGTEILTDQGPVLIEDLSVGDLVSCKGAGFKPILWVGRRWYKTGANPEQHLLPIKIGRGALGPNIPTQDLYVSPNHCVQFQHPLCHLYFTEPAMLVPAKHLVGMKGIRRANLSEFGYFHILLDTHELIEANGIWAESLFFGDVAKTSMEQQAYEEVLEIFPELDSRLMSLKTCMPVTQQFEASVLKALVSDAIA